MWSRKIRSMLASLVAAAAVHSAAEVNSSAKNWKMSEKLIYRATMKRLEHLNSSRMSIVALYLLARSSIHDL